MSNILVSSLGDTATFWRAHFPSHQRRIGVSLRMREGDGIDRIHVSWSRTVWNRRICYREELLCFHNRSECFIEMAKAEWCSQCWWWWVSLPYFLPTTSQVRLHNSRTGSQNCPSGPHRWEFVTRMSIEWTLPSAPDFGTSAWALSYSLALSHNWSLIIGLFWERHLVSVTRPWGLAFDACVHEDPGNWSPAVISQATCNWGVLRLSQMRFDWKWWSQHPRVEKVLKKYV